MAFRFPVQAQRLLAGTAVGLAAVTMAMPAQALEFMGSSATPGKTLIRFTLGGDIPLIDPIGVNTTLRLYPGGADVFGGSPGSNAMLIDGEASILAKFEIPTPLAGIGIKPYLAPYLGARYMGVPTFAFNTSNTFGYAQAAGPTYGLRAIVKLPLDFTVWAYGGASTLMWGRRDGFGFTGSSGGQTLDAGGATLPVFGANVNWSPLGLFTAYAGMETTVFPTDLLGSSSALGSARSTVTGLSVGLRFLFLSI
jgi:hypothetical protein